MQKNRFITPYGISQPPLKAVLKWKLSTLFFKKEKVADDDFRLPVHFLDKKDLKQEEDFILWLGHASFYIQIDGIKILTDPIFYNLPFIPRLSAMPIDPLDLQPDLILVSHGHYDHLDLKSLEVLKIYEKNIPIIMPLQLSQYLKKSANTKELNWYEKYQYKDLTITALPASHWHRRGMYDFNKALWCSFALTYKNKHIFFAGDTAFDTHFEEIRQKFGTIDLALMPIGAYKPIEVMKPSHMNPKEAIQATKILNAKKMIPYHYGTFKLSDEPIGEPHSWISKLQNHEKQTIKILDVGEIYKRYL